MGWFDSLRRVAGIKPGDAARLAALAPQVDALEAELRRLGWWQSAPPAPERMQFTMAFGIDKLAFGEWLQWVFLPAARSMLAGERPLPPSSMVGVHAVRELDGDDDAQMLCTILIRVDTAVNEGR
jgi:uncharacterized protein YqcC (DUF446 family)